MNATEITIRFNLITDEIETLASRTNYDRSFTARMYVETREHLKIEQRRLADLYHKEKQP